jgi:GAF domain-containing protein
VAAVSAQAGHSVIAEIVPAESAQCLFLEEAGSTELAAYVLVPDILKAGAAALGIEQCAVLLLDNRTRTLAPTKTLGLPAAFFRGFSSVMVGPRAETSGKAVATCTTSITPDLMEDPDWELYRPLAEPLGIRSVWAEPIVNGAGHAFGSFTVFRRVTGPPDLRQLTLLQLVGSLLANAYDPAMATVA